MSYTRKVGRSYVQLENKLRRMMGRNGVKLNQRALSNLIAEVSSRKKIRLRSRNAK